MATFGPQRRPHFSPYVYVSFLRGVRSLVVEQGLWETDPRSYEFLVGFARDNDLNVVEEWEQEELAMVVGQ